MWNKSKGSSDMIRRGSAFRPSGPEKVEAFPESHPVAPPMPLTEREEALVNAQRLLVNHMLSATSNTRVHFTSNKFNGDAEIELWKKLAAEVGACYYPAELMTDSRSVMLGIPKKSTSNSAKLAKSLAALESSEQKGDTGEPTGDQSPKSGEEEAESSDESLGADDYNLQMDFEDEGARDAYDDGDDGGGGGDYGGEF